LSDHPRGKTDRLYRNFKDYVIIDELGLQVRLVKENAIISPTSRSSEKLMHGLKVLIAKNFLDNLSEETSRDIGPATPR
jgi:site-specific DNA recombinase